MAIPKVVLASATMVDIDIRPVSVVSVCVRACVRVCVSKCVHVFVCCVLRVPKYVNGIHIFSCCFPESLWQHHLGWGELPPARIHRAYDEGAQHEHSSSELGSTVLCSTWTVCHTTYLSQ